MVFRIELLSWRREYDVTETRNGGVMKKIISEPPEAEWQTPGALVRPSVWLWGGRMHDVC